MNDLIIHGLGQATPGGGGIPIEGLNPMMVSDQLKGLGLTFAHQSLGTLADRRCVNHYHEGKVYVLHGSGVSIYDALSGEVIADNAHATAAAHMSPDTAASDGSYYLAQANNLYKYGLDGTLVWETSAGSLFTCMAVDGAGIYLGNTASSNHYVYRYNRVNGQNTWTSPNISHKVIALAVNSSAVLATTESFSIYRLHPSNGTQVYLYSIPNSDTAYALAIEPTTNHFYSMSYRRTLRKHSFQTGEPIFTLTNTNITTVYNLFIDSSNNIYTVSNREITKLDNQLSGFIWRENHDIGANPINGFGFDKEKGDIYILRAQTAKILSTEKEWSAFIPHQFEGIVNHINLDKSGNIYGASDDWTVRKFNALGDALWVYKNSQFRAVNFVKADDEGNVFIADTARVFKKLNAFGSEEWSTNLSGVTGSVTDLVVDGDGVIFLSVSNWNTSAPSRKDYLVKVSPQGVVLKTSEIGSTGVFNHIHLWDDKTVLAIDRLYDTESFRCLRFFTGVNPIFSVRGDFLYGILYKNLKAFNRYSGGAIYSSEIEGVDPSNYYLKAVQGSDGAIYVVDDKKTLIKLSERGEPLWSYQTRDSIKDIRVDDEQSIYLATGYYIEKLTQTFGISSYEKK